MTTMRSLTRSVEKSIRDNSPAILTSLGVTGALTTAYLAAKASFRAARKIDAEAPCSPVKDKAQLVWKMYIPTAAAATMTVACVVGGAKIGAKRAAAAYSLMAITDKAFDEYKEKVVEQLGEKKEEKIRAEIAQDRMADGPGIVVVGKGSVLCYEMYTGRYFNSDMETLRSAQNTINEQLIAHNDANLNDLYHLLGLPGTSYSSTGGWTSDKMFKMNYTTVLSEDGRPCIAFDYNYVRPI